MRAEMADFYTDNFFVPPNARWRRISTSYTKTSGRI